MAAISISVGIIIFGNLGLQLGRSPYKLLWIRIA